VGEENAEARGKWRTVCCLPGKTDFGPLGRKGKSGDAVIMTVVEYETIRLIDLSGLPRRNAPGR
jgi:predicted DNA-binding protein (UPF0251 family)